MRCVPFDFRGTISVPSAYLPRWVPGQHYWCADSSLAVISCCSCRLLLLFLDHCPGPCRNIRAGKAILLKEYLCRRGGAEVVEANDIAVKPHEPIPWF